MRTGLRRWISDSSTTTLPDACVVPAAVNNSGQFESVLCDGWWFSFSVVGRWTATVPVRCLVCVVCVCFDFIEGADGSLGVSESVQSALCKEELKVCFVLMF